MAKSGDGGGCRDHDVNSDLTANADLAILVQWKLNTHRDDDPSMGQVGMVPRCGQ